MMVVVCSDSRRWHRPFFFFFWAGQSISINTVWGLVATDDDGLDPPGEFVAHQTCPK